MRSELPGSFSCLRRRDIQNPDLATRAGSRSDRRDEVFTWAILARQDFDLPQRFLRCSSDSAPHPLQERFDANRLIQDDDAAGLTLKL